MNDGTPQQILHHLAGLAHDRSQVARGDLAHGLVDLFEQHHDRLTPREQQLAQDIVDTVLAGAPQTLRADLSHRVAESTVMPRRLVIQLARDMIDVANPILWQSPLLTDADLVSLVVQQGVDHARVIALRRDISEAVADALVVTGDPTVLQSLAENMGARLFAQALEAMTQAARFAEQLSRALLRRPDMTPELTVKLYWWMGSELRRVALKRFGIISGQVDQALDGTVEDLLGRYALNRDDHQVMGQVADWLGAHEMMSPRVLVQVLRLGHFRLFSMMVARLTGLPLPITDLIVTEDGGRSLAVVCRAMKIDKPVFVSIFLLSRGARSGDQVVHPRELNNALQAFDRLSVTIAEQLLENWRRDPTYVMDRALARAVVETVH